MVHGTAQEFQALNSRNADAHLAIMMIDEPVSADVQAFADQLLAAMVEMASRSKRRQADLSAVLRRSKIDSDPDQVSSAMAHLRASGLIHEIVPLYDGGMLVSITSQGMDRPRSGDQWAFLNRRGMM